MDDPRARRPARVLAALGVALLPLLPAGWQAAQRVPAACEEPGTPVALRACLEGARSLEGAERLLFGAGLDPNRASAEHLALLPGVGPVRAGAIVDERRRGRFQRVEDLRRVHGIGPRTIQKLRPWLQIEAAVADP